RFYRAPRFPFAPEELPHFHKARGSTHEAFALWRNQGTDLGAEIAGAWKRPLFVGGWTHSHDTAASPPPPSQLPAQEGESTFNLQTPSVFVDIRVPKAAAALLGHHTGFHTMTDFELRLFARRHAFAGYTKVEPLALPSSSSPARDDIADNGRSSGGGRGGPKGRRPGQGEGGSGASVATRHHCIDWNYVGEPRPRPNKWRVEMGPGGDVWREWGFAKDAFDQHVYMERWERLPGGGGPFIALRRRPSSSAPDALLVVCGDHFGLVVDRAPSSTEGGAGSSSRGGGGGGLVGLVDEAIALGDRRKAIDFMSLEASHGRVSAQEGKSLAVLLLWSGRLPWTVDCSLHPWLEGRRPFSGSVLMVSPDGLSVDWVSNTSRSAGSVSSCPGWNGVRLEGVWDVVENTMLSPSRHWSSSSSISSPRVVPPLITFDALFTGSGAEVLTRGRGARRRDNGESFSSPRAKL
ncbi:unnamed protein product, partial [Hapterophycus canaliculatus]